MPEHVPQEFLAEAEDMLESIRSAALQLEQGATAAGADHDPDTLNAFFRGVHSLKGLAGMAGITGLSDLSHHLESLLDQLRLGKVPLSPEVMDTLFDGISWLERLVTEAGEGAVGRSQPDEFLSRVERLSAEGGRGGPDEEARGRDPLDRLDLPETLRQTLTEYEEHRLRENLRRGRHILKVSVVFSLETFDQDLGKMTEAIKGFGELISTLPSPGASPEDGIAFTLLVGADLLPDAATEQLAAWKPQVESVVRAAPFSAPPSSPAAAPTQAGNLRTGEPAQAESMTESTLPRPIGFTQTVRVPIGRLDALLARVGELFLIRTAVLRMGQELRAMGQAGVAAELQRVGRSLERSLSDLQGDILEARMVPIGQIFSRLQQMVRKLSKELGKQVRFQSFGGDTEVDKMIIEDLSDPLMHLLRNAIDHGIEAPKVRQDLGKPEAGTVTLGVGPRGNHAVITVEDDGAGMDVDRILQMAVERGLVAEGQDLPKEEIVQFIFHPGFSTKAQASEVSGRGVGMDVVKKNIARLQGMIQVGTESGKGSRFTLTLPMTLATLRALVVQVGKETYAVPLVSVLETRIVRKGEIQRVDNREVLLLRGEPLSLLSMARVFEIPSDGGVGAIHESPTYVVVVGLAEHRLGLLVDRLVGQQELVIRPLGSRLQGIPGVAGATELDDQHLILVLDVAGLIRDTLELARVGG